MDNNIMENMINNNQSCYISNDENGNIIDVYIRPKAVEESLKDKLQQEDITKVNKIISNSSFFNKMNMDLCNGCQECNCINKCKKLRALPNGNINADIMFIDKQPTNYETAISTACSDRNGILISLILDKLNVSRESVYFTDMIKCNAKLDDNSFNECINKYLIQEIQHVKPKIIICNSLTLLKICINKNIFRNLSKEVSYGNIYDAELEDGNKIKVTAIYDLDTVLQKTGEDYIKCKNELWSQVLNAFKLL